jgi:pectate lyase
MTNARLCIICLLLAVTSAQAFDAVNVNFQKDTAFVEIGGGAAFGSGVVMTWNSFDRYSTTMTNLKDSTNTSTTVSLTPNQPSGAGWSTSFFSGLIYGTNIMNAYIHNNNTGYYNMIIAGLTSGSTYDLYLYGHGDAENQNTVFTVGGVSKTSTIYVAGLTALTENAHYVVFRGVAADTSGQITVNWGATGTYAAINGLQIVRGTLNAKATAPAPYVGEYLISSPTTLSWTNPSPLNGAYSITCTVYLGTTSNRTSMDSKTLTANASSVQINTANFPNFGSLPRGIDYYWIVDCVDGTPGADPARGKGDAWMFHNYLPNQDGYGGQATGGTGGTTITVSTAAALQDYAARTGAYIIRVSGTIDLGPNGEVLPASNKTIKGVDHNSTILGNIVINTGVTNVIVRNLNISNRYNDGITVWGSSNVFITHCNIYDCNDGSIDITQSADNVTVSWCRFSYRNPSHPDHRFVSLACDARSTFHHNWYDYGCDQRMPSCQSLNGGTAIVHMYNNYFSCSGNSYCTAARENSKVLSENNYYTNVDDPLGISPGTNGLIQSIGNIYSNCTGNQYMGGSTLFTPTYTYTPDATEDTPAIVMASAGNRLYGDFDGNNNIDGADLNLFLGLWLSNSRPAFYQDLNGDSTVSFYEFSQLAGNWLVTY